MGASMIITPSMFDTFIYLLVFGIGLDFIWCGSWFLAKNKIIFFPKLFGYLALKLFEISNKKSTSKNEFAKNVFSMRAAGVYLLLGGLQLVIRSVRMLLIIFSK